MASMLGKKACVFNLATFKQDCKDLAPSMAAIAESIGRCASTFSDIAGGTGRTSIELVHDFVQKYYPSDPERYKRYIRDAQGVANYEAYYEQELNVVRANFAAINDKAGKMRLNMASVDKIFGYAEGYYNKALACGEIALDYLVKFAELANCKVQEFELQQVAEEKSSKKTAAINYSEKLDDIDAALIGVLKALQSIDKKLCDLIN